MSLLGRLFGQSQDDPYTEGIVLYEAGRFADAITSLRRAGQEKHSGPESSLITFHLRQALLGEGRRLLRAGRADDALPYLAEAAAAWESFPDVQFLHGTALGLTGDWAQPLLAAHQGLPFKADYCEGLSLINI